MPSWVGNLALIFGMMLSFMGIVAILLRTVFVFWSVKTQLAIIAEKLQVLSDKMDDHMEWHGTPGNAPARKPVVRRPNGGNPR